MDVRFVDAVPGRPTLLSVCFQYPDGSGGNVTTVDSAAALVSERDVDLVERWLSPTAIALAVPEVPLPVRRHLLRRATERGALRVASLTTAEIEEVRETGFLALVDLLSMNEDEAAALAGAPFPSGAPEPFLERLLRRRDGVPRRRPPRRHRGRAWSLRLRRDRLGARARLAGRRGQHGGGGGRAPRRRPHRPRGRPAVRAGGRLAREPRRGGRSRARSSSGLSSRPSR